MTDTISRQAAIDAFDEIESEIASGTGFQYEKWRKRFCELPSAQRWIPCSERMPEEKDAGILKKLGINKRSDTVLVTVRVKEARITDHARTNDGIWHWELEYVFPDHEVVAWMPLPEPYKVGEKDE